jgi:hypothetical protein
MMMKHSFTTKFIDDIQKNTLINIFLFFFMFFFVISFMGILREYISIHNFNIIENFLLYLFCPFISILMLIILRNNEKKCDEILMTYFFSFVLYFDIAHLLNDINNIDNMSNIYGIYTLNIIGTTIFTIVSLLHKDRTINILNIFFICNMVFNRKCENEYCDKIIEESLVLLFTFILTFITRNIAINEIHKKITEDINFGLFVIFMGKVFIIQDNNIEMYSKLFIIFVISIVVYFIEYNRYKYVVYIVIMKLYLSHIFQYDNYKFCSVCFINVVMLFIIKSLKIKKIFAE